MGGWGLNPISDITHLVSNVGGAVTQVDTAAVQAFNGIVHEGVMLTMDAVNLAGAAVSAGLGEAEGLLSMIGDSHAIRASAAALQSASDELHQAGQGISGIEQQAAASGWVGQGATAFASSTAAGTRDASVASTAFGECAQALSAYANALDAARADVEAAISRLRSANPLDIAVHPTIVTHVVSRAQSAITNIQPAASAAADQIRAAARLAAPIVGHSTGHSKSGLQMMVDSNVHSFLNNPFGYVVGYFHSALDGFLGAAGQLASMVWTVDKAGFQIMTGNDQGLKTLGKLGNQVWQMSTPYWLFKFATDPPGAMAQGRAIVNQYLNVNELVHGQANKAVGHLAGEVGFQVAVAVVSGAVIGELSGAAGIADVPPPLTGGDLPADVTLKGFVGESSGDPAAPFGGGVHYMSPIEREALRVYVDGQGLLRSASNGNLFDTSALVTARQGAGSAIFVMDDSGNLYASQQLVGVIHHSSLLAGGPVVGAGEMQVDDGVLTAMNDQSGHYRPLPEENDRVLAALRQQGLQTGPNFSQTGWFGGTR